MSAKTAAAKSAKPVTKPKFFMKGEKTYVHTLFKLGVETMLKNVSWKKYQPQIVPVEHVHFFHDHDRTGKKQKYCSKVGGHFHEIITHDEKGNPLVDEDGFLSPKCGPALREEIKKLPGGKAVKKIVPVSYDRLTEDSDQPVLDQHAHDIENMGSEEMSENKIRKIQEENVRGLNSMKASAPAPQVIEDAAPIS